jgi:hypothetical protein
MDVKYVRRRLFFYWYFLLLFQKGSIEIGSRKEGIKHCIVEGVGLLGLSKTSNEIARCISE